MTENTIHVRILQQFNQSIDNEGTLWRVADFEYFKELLKDQSKNIEQEDLNLESCMSFLVTGLKALLNDSLGVKEFSTDFKFLNKELYEELGSITNQASFLLCALLSKQDSGTMLDQENCWIAIHSLQYTPLSISSLEHILSVLLNYLSLSELT